MDKSEFTTRPLILQGLRTRTGISRHAFLRRKTSLCWVQGKNVKSAVHFKHYMSSGFCAVGITVDSVRYHSALTMRKENKTKQNETKLNVSLLFHIQVHFFTSKLFRNQACHFGARRSHWLYYNVWYYKTENMWFDLVSWEVGPEDIDALKQGLLLKREPHVVLEPGLSPPQDFPKLPCENL